MRSKDKPFPPEYYHYNLLPRNYKIFLSLGMLATYKHIAFSLCRIYAVPVFRYHVAIALSFMPMYLEYELSTCRWSFFYDLTPCVDASAAYTNVNDLLCLVAPQHQHRIQIVINVKRYA